MSLLVPRCEHGNIILGCPFDDCESQTLYLIEQATVMDEWERRQTAEAKRLLSLVTEDTE